jgi:hypothetical protein
MAEQSDGWGGGDWAKVRVRKKLLSDGERICGEGGQSPLNFAVRLRE